MLSEDENVHFARSEVVTVHLSGLPNDGNESLFKADQSIKAIQIVTSLELVAV